MSALGQELIQAIRRTAERNPDHKYVQPVIDTGVQGLPMCVYVHEGQPSCLIGQGLWELGIIDEAFEDLGVNQVGIGSDKIIHAIPILETLDIDERNWLRTVQSGQDSGYSWGCAVERADVWYSSAVAV